MWNKSVIWNFVMGRKDSGTMKEKGISQNKVKLELNNSKTGNFVCWVGGGKVSTLEKGKKETTKVHSPTWPASEVF